MKLLILILLFLAFLQTTILPLDLVLIVLLIRTYLKDSPQNLILATIFGLLVSHLSNQQTWVYSLLYLLFVQLVSVFSKLPFHKNLTLGALLLLAFLFLEKLIIAKISNTTTLFMPIIFEMILSIPIYFTLKLWEERFVVRSEIKLRT